MNEDEVLEKITRLLEQGCTMLAGHHECGAPLFFFLCEVVCPVCSFPSATVASEKQQQDAALGNELSGEAMSESLPGGESEEFQIENPDANSDDLTRAKLRLNDALLSRLKALTLSLESEQDLDRLKKQLGCVEALLRVFSLMR